MVHDLWDSRVYGTALMVHSWSDVTPGHTQTVQCLDQQSRHFFENPKLVLQYLSGNEELFGDFFYSGQKK